VHAPDGEQESIVLDVWDVVDGRRGELVEALTAIYERLRVLEGFIEGRLLTGADPTHLASYARMRSARDRDNAMQDREIQALIRGARKIARPHFDAFTELREFEPPPRPR